MNRFAPMRYRLRTLLWQLIDPKGLTLDWRIVWVLAAVLFALVLLNVVLLTYLIWAHPA